MQNIKMAIINYSFDFFFIKNSCNLGIFLIFLDEKISPHSLQMNTFSIFSLKDKNQKRKRKLKIEKKNNFLLVNKPLMLLMSM